jgi:hypothetical protein
MINSLKIVKINVIIRKSKEYNVINHIVKNINNNNNKNKTQKIYHHLY